MAVSLNKNYPMRESKGTMRVRLYPSTIVPDESVRLGERGSWTPGQLQALAASYAKLPEQARASIVIEHNKDDPSMNVGIVRKLEYNQMDGWLWAKGDIKPEYRDWFERTVVHSSNGSRGVSLCYKIDNVANYKKILEFSLVKNPDYKRASIVNYHSAGPLIATVIATAENIPAIINGEMTDPSVDYSTKYTQLESGEYVVPHEELSDGVRAHLISTGVAEPRVIVAGVDRLRSMSEDERELFLSGLLAKEGLHREERSRIADETQHKALESKIHEAHTLVSTLTAGNDAFDDGTQRGLGKLMINNDDALFVAKVAADALSKKDETIAELRCRAEKLEKRQKALYERGKIRSAPGSVMQVSHSASSSSSTPKLFDSFWDSFQAKAKHGLDVPSRSPSSSKGVEIHEHSANKRAMRENDDDESTERGKALKLHRSSFWNGMALCASPDAKDGIVEHSAEGARAASGDRSKMQSNTAYALSLFNAFREGKRNYGPAKRNWSKSASVVAPPLMTALIHLTNDTPVDTNEQAFIRGHEDKPFEGLDPSALKYFPHAQYTSRQQHRFVDTDLLSSRMATFA